MPCMLALEEVTRKDEGEDDNDEENHDEDDVQVHRRYSGGHHHFWEKNVELQKTHHKTGLISSYRWKAMVSLKPLSSLLTNSELPIDTIGQL